MRLATVFGIFSAVLSVAIRPAWAQKVVQTASVDPEVEPVALLWKREHASRFLLLVPGENPAPNSPTKSAVSLAAWLQERELVAHDFGGIAAVGSHFQNVPTEKLPAPNFLATGNAWQNKMNALPQLLASLSSRQWQQITSKAGMGTDTLSEEQKTLWELSVPDPFVLERTSFPGSDRPAPREQTRTLTETERNQVRLRVKLIGDAYARFTNRPGRFPVIFQKNVAERGAAGETFLHLRQEGVYADPRQSNAQGISAYGQPIARREPREPQPLHPDVETALAEMSVEADALRGEPSTIGTLLDVIARTTGVTLLADAKLRASATHLIGQGSMRASDLLRALLFATGRVVRILPPIQPGEKPLYVVAPSEGPTGRIAGKIADWYQAMESAQTVNRSEAFVRIAESDPLPLMRFDRDDPAALGETNRQKAIEAMQQRVDGSGNGFIAMPLSDFPGATQNLINRKAQELAQQSNQQDKGDDAHVGVEKIDTTFYCGLGYIAPGTGELAGEIDTEPLGDPAEWLRKNKADKIEPVAGRIVIIAPDSVAEAVALVRAAHAAQVKEVWVQASPKIIAAAVEVGMPVRGVVSVLGVAENTPGTLPRDENLYGKPSREWLAADNPDVLRDAMARVREVASLSGVAGVVLRDAVPPGYRGLKNESTNRAVPLGFSLAHRRAFALETGQDPADIVETMPIKGVWREEPAAVYAWQQWKQNQLLSLWRAVREAAGDKALLIEGCIMFAERGDTVPAAISTFVTWEQGDTPPPMAAMFRNTQSAVPAIPATPATWVVVAGIP